MEHLKTTLIHLQCELVAERNLINPDALSWLQYDILFTLSQHSALRPAQLSLILGVSKVKLAKSLKALKQLNYISQTRDSQDARALPTLLTEKGRRLLNNIHNTHHNLATLAAQIMTPQEQQQFSQLANRLINKLKQQRIDHETRHQNH